MGWPYHHQNRKPQQRLYDLRCLKKFCLRILIKDHSHLHNSLPPHAAFKEEIRDLQIYHQQTNNHMTPQLLYSTCTTHTLATMNLHTIQHTHCSAYHTYTTQLSVTNVYHASYRHHCCTLFLHSIMHAAPYVPYAPYLFLFFIYIILYSIVYTLIYAIESIIIAIYFILIMYYLWLSQLKNFNKFTYTTAVMINILNLENKYRRAAVIKSFRKFSNTEEGAGKLEAAKRTRHSKESKQN